MGGRDRKNAMSRACRSMVDSPPARFGLDLVDHDQGVVAEGAAHLDALRAALAVDRVHEDPERAPVLATLGRDVAVLRGRGEVLVGRGRRDGRLRLRGRERLDPRLELGLRHDDPEDRAVGAGADAGHAPDALVEEELGDARGEAAEVAGGRGAGRDDAAGQAGVRGQFDVGDAATVGRHDRAPEVLDVRLHVEDRRRHRREARFVRLLEFAGVLDERCPVRHRWSPRRPTAMAWTTSVSDSTPIGSVSSRSSTTIRRWIRSRSIFWTARVSGTDGWTVSAGCDIRWRTARPCQFDHRYSVARTRARSVCERTPTSEPAASTTGRPLMWC